MKNVASESDKRLQEQKKAMTRRARQAFTRVALLWPEPVKLVRILRVEERPKQPVRVRLCVGHEGEEKHGEGESDIGSMDEAVQNAIKNACDDAE